MGLAFAVRHSAGGAFRRGGESAYTVNLTKREIEPGLVALELAGYVRMGPDCKQLASQIDALVQNNEHRVILDLSRVDLIDSAGIGTVVLCFTRLKKAGGSLRIAGAKGMVDTVLHTTQVNRAIQMFPTVEAAAKDFPSPS